MPGTVVRERGLEPLRPKTLEPKSSASTNSATRAEAATHAAATSSRLAGAARVVENSDRLDVHVEHGQFSPPDAQVAAGSGSVDAELLAHAGDVPGGLDVVLGEFDLALGIDDDG